MTHEIKQIADGLHQGCSAGSPKRHVHVVAGQVVQLVNALRETDQRAAAAERELAALKAVPAPPAPETVVDGE
jgi:hypothetical protein